MDKDKVINILNIFYELNAPVWLAGGWAVDAVVEKQTRSHRDVDLAFDQSNEEKIITKFVSLGYSVVDDARPTRFVLKHKDGSEIDMHPVVFNINGSGEQLVPERKIKEREVPCLNAEQLIIFHMGYEPLAKDRHNMQMLHDFLDMPLPSRYK